jgi:hypothetical protein
MAQTALAARGHPTLNSARTTFVADNGRLLRGAVAGTEYGGHLSMDDLLYFKSKGTNALHLYAENFVSGYAAGTRASDVDAVVEMTRDNGMYLIITIANSWANGTYRIVAWHSGKAIDAGGTTNKAQIQQYAYWGGNNQLFKFASTGGAYFRITPNCAPGSCLDVSGQSTADKASVQLWQWVGGNNQQWATQAP